MIPVPAQFQHQSVRGLYTGRQVAVVTLEPGGHMPGRPGPQFVGQQVKIQRQRIAGLGVALDPAVGLDVTLVESGPNIRSRLSSVFLVMAY